MTESAPEQTIEPRDVTDEEPIVEGEIPEGLEVVTTDAGVSSDDLAADGDVDPEPLAGGGSHDPSPEELAQQLQADNPDVPDEYKPTEEELAAHEDEKYPPHELDLPPAPEDLPAPHAPYDPSHGAR